MPTLDWLGKDKVVNHDRHVKFHVLNHIYNFGGDSQNKIIHGDNLLALKSLLPLYEGKIKCIYIDPPYNTGNEGWIYNDNVNSPQIQKWLGQVVGREGEDYTRHDKWLCMMYPRLKLLKKLLSNDGAIFISINFRDEYHTLRLICDEIFGSQNYVGTLTWESLTQPTNSGRAKFGLQIKTEPIICYRINAAQNIFELAQADTKRNYPHQGKFGKCRFEIIETSSSGNFNRPTMKFKILGQYPREGKRWKIGEETARQLEENGRLEIVNGIVKKAVYPEDESSHNYPNQGKFGKCRFEIIEKSDAGNFNRPTMKFKILGQYPREGKRWQIGEETARQLEENGRLEIVDGIIKRAIYPEDEVDKITYKPFWSHLRAEDVGTAQTGKEILNSIMDAQIGFDTVKPPRLIEELIKHLPKDSIILDAFAGSGTTAHAVINLNREDDGDRKFILIEMENYAETITAERVKRVGGNFNFYEVGAQIFIDDEINPNLDVEKIREYIWQVDTHTEYFKPEVDDCTAFMGVHKNIAYYFHEGTLDYEFLATMRTRADFYVIYAEACAVDKEFLNKHKIEFRKIPRDILSYELRVNF